MSANEVWQFSVNLESIKDDRRDQWVAYATTSTPNGLLSPGKSILLFLTKKLLTQTGKVCTKFAWYVSITVFNACHFVSSYASCPLIIQKLCYFWCRGGCNSSIKGVQVFPVRVVENINSIINTYYSMHVPYLKIECSAAFVCIQYLYSEKEFNFFLMQCI